MELLRQQWADTPEGVPEGDDDGSGTTADGDELSPAGDAPQPDTEGNAETDEAGSDTMAPPFRKKA